jgi:hypothetical protein
MSPRHRPQAALDVSKIVEIKAVASPEEKQILKS